MSRNAIIMSRDAITTVVMQSQLCFHHGCGYILTVVTPRGRQVSAPKYSAWIRKTVTAITTPYTGPGGKCV